MPTHPDDTEDLPFGSIGTITADENLMILVARPGEESLVCGGLIAQCCRRGRPPFVMVLGDGSASAPHSDALPPGRLASLHERETREAVGLLGLDDDRLLMAGLFDGTIPGRGAASFDALVRGVIQVMWRTDCNIACSAWPIDGDAAAQATHDVADEVSARSGVGRLSYAGSVLTAGHRPVGARAWRLDIKRQAEAKQRAIAAHRALHGRPEVGAPAHPAAGAGDPFEIILAAGP